MKKITSIFCALILLSSPAQAASGVFLGVDYLNVNTIHKAENNSVLLGPEDGDKKSSVDSGYGVNIGARVDPLFFFVSAEAFYERLNSVSKGFDQITVGQGPKINVDERYGAKANVGITILPWITPFVTYGVARIKYNAGDPDWKEAPLYGAGLIFDIPTTNFSVKAAYDMQRFKFDYQTSRSKTTLGVAHVGLTYTF